MKNPTVATSVEVIRGVVKGIEGAEVIIRENYICFTYGDEDHEFKLDTVKDLAKLAKAIRVVESFK